MKDEQVKFNFLGLFSFDGTNISKRMYWLIILIILGLIAVLIMAAWHGVSVWALIPPVVKKLQSLWGR